MIWTMTRQLSHITTAHIGTFAAIPLNTSLPIPVGLYAGLLDLSMGYEVGTLIVLLAREVQQV